MKSVWFYEWRVMLGTLQIYFCISPLEGSPGVSKKELAKASIEAIPDTDLQIAELVSQPPAPIC